MSQIRLEPFAESHLEDVACLVADAAVHRFTGVPVPVPPGFPRTWLGRYEGGRRDGTREAFAVLDAADGRFLGLAMAVRIDREAQTAELGYALSPAARGRGVATEALRALTGWALDELGALRLELRISVDNEASKAVAARCGYVREGVLRSVHFKQGLREDTEVWSRLPSDALREAYDAQLRGRVPAVLPEGVRCELDGPLVRFVGFAHGGHVEYRDVSGLASDEIDELIARQVAFFAARGERFEWKLHGHDLPADLPQRLRAAGFVPEDRETVVIAPVARVASAPQLPAGVALRTVSDRRDLDRIAAIDQAIWGDDRGWLAEGLECELAADPDALTIVVAEAGADVICAGWIRFEEDTEFASLWGGGTLPGWRGRGIYRAVVAHRANLAAARGYRYLQVDASDDSRPILERLGFVAVTTTTPYVWDADAARAGRRAAR